MLLIMEKAKLVYLQHVRFFIGNAFPPALQFSPKAIQAVWGPHLATPENPGPPEWVELAKSTNGRSSSATNTVTLEYAVGRIARLACSSWNAISVCVIAPLRDSKS